MTATNQKGFLFLIYIVASGSTHSLYRSSCRTPKTSFPPNWNMAKRTLDAFFKPAAISAPKRSKTDSNTTTRQNDNNQQVTEDSGHPSQHPTYPTPIANLPSHIQVSLTHATSARTPREINNQPDLDLIFSSRIFRLQQRTRSLGSCAASSRSTASNTPFDAVIPILRYAPLVLRHDFLDRTY